MSCLGVGNPVTCSSEASGSTTTTGTGRALSCAGPACVVRNWKGPLFRYFAQYSIREHRDIFRHAVRLLHNGS